MGRKPMTPEQRAQMRKRILDSARERFLECGLDGLSMRGIASKVGVSSMTLYLYYGGRNDIVRHIVAEGFLMLNQNLRDALDAAPEGEELEHFSRAYLAFALDNAKYYLAMHRYLLDADDTPDELVDGPRDTAVALLSDILGNHKKAVAVWSGLHGVSQLAIGGQLPANGTASDVGALLAAKVAA